MEKYCYCDYMAAHWNMSMRRQVNIKMHDELEVFEFTAFRFGGGGKNGSASVFDSVSNGFFVIVSVFYLEISHRDALFALFAVRSYFDFRQSD